MLKKVIYYTRPPEARQDAPLPIRGRRRNQHRRRTHSHPPSPEPAETGSFPMKGDVDDVDTPRKKIGNEARLDVPGGRAGAMRPFSASYCHTL
jgi:hypothetical protein